MTIFGQIKKVKILIWPFVSTVSWVLLSWTLSFTRVSAATTTWELQAERLQLVSATLLDNIPIAEMPMGDGNIMVKSNVSLLPKLNNTVGAKNEKVPSSPVHGVPTLQVDLCPVKGAILTAGIRAWGGYLPPGSEKAVGLKAVISEKSFGAGFIARFKTGIIEPGFEAGAQRSISKVDGAITSVGAKDQFRADTLIGYGAIGFRVPAIRMWANILSAARTSISTFSIPEDGTFFTLIDNHGKIAFQGAGGFDLPLGLNVGVAQLYVPERLAMLRVFGGIKVGF